MSKKSFPIGSRVEVLGDDNVWHPGIVVERTTEVGKDGRKAHMHQVEITGDVPSHHRTWREPDGNEVVIRPSKEVRPLHEIARDIRRHWPKVWFGAVPYLDAMGTLRTMEDKYGCDSAKSIVLYFLSNAATWKGEDAKRIKEELKAMVK